MHVKESMCTQREQYCSDWPKPGITPTSQGCDFWILLDKPKHPGKLVGQNLHFY